MGKLVSRIAPLFTLEGDESRKAVMGAAAKVFENALPERKIAFLLKIWATAPDPDCPDTHRRAIENIGFCADAMSLEEESRETIRRWLAREMAKVRSAEKVEANVS